MGLRHPVPDIQNMSVCRDTHTRYYVSNSGPLIAIVCVF